MKKNILVNHTYCMLKSIVITTDRTLDEINKIIYLIQYIEADLPSIEDEADGIYQDDLKVILSDLYKIETIYFNDQHIDHEIDIILNWEYSGASSYKEYKNYFNNWHTMKDKEKESYQQNFIKELYNKAYIENLELYLINYRLKQIKNKDSKDFKLFIQIKNAIVNKNNSFYWKGWLSSDESKNIDNYLRGMING